MKLYLVFLCVAFVFDFGELRKLVGSTNHEQLNQALDIYNKTKTKCPNIDDDAVEATKKAAECVENLELGSDTVCTVIKKNFPKCTKPIIDLMTNCVDDEYKFALPLAIKIVTELFNPCIFDNDAEEDKIEACKVLKEKRNYERLMTKTEVCDLRPKGKECLKQLTATCKNPLTKKTVMDFHDVSEDIMDEECNAV
nr:unnamed protein product [Callosobruchus chinensis]